MIATYKSLRGSTKVRCGLLSAAAVLAVSQLGTHSASANTFTWSGAANSTWDTTSNNWNAGVPWANVSADVAIFNVVPTAPVSVASNITLVRSIILNTSGWTFTNGGGTFSNPSSKVVFYTGYFDTDTDTVSTVIGNSTNTALVKAGSGTLTLSGANTYTGGTTVTTGTLRLDAKTGSISGALVLDGGTFIYDNTNSTGTKTLTLGAVTAGPASEGGEGTVINIQGGAGSSTLTLASSGLGGSTGSTINYISGGSANTNDAIFITGTMNISGASFFNGADYAIKDATGFVRAPVYGGTGVDATFIAADTSGASLANNSANNYLVTTQSIASQATAAAETIKFGGSGSINMTLATASTVLSLANGGAIGGILRSGGGSTTITGPSGASIALAGTGSFSTDSAIDTLTIDVKITGTPVFIKSGGGTIFMTANAVNSYGPASGIGTYVNNGILSVVQNSNLGNQGDGITINGGTLQANGTFGLYNINPGANNRTLGLTNDATIDVTGSNTFTIASAVQDGSLNGGDPGRLIKTDTGTLFLTAATNSYAGGTFINNGTLEFNGTTTLTGVLAGGNAQNNIFALGGGTFDYDNTSSSGAKTLTIPSVSATLTFVAGDSTVKNIKGGASSSTLTFAAMNARTPGATGNFVTPDGVNGSNNFIDLTGVALGFINQGIFIDGSNYAIMNSAGTFVRVPVYGTDTGANLGFMAADFSGTSLANSATSNYLVTTTSIASQSSANAKTIKFGGGVNPVNMTLAPGAILTLASGGILVSGNTTTTITGSSGANITAASGVEYVFRTDVAADSLTIDTPIVANGVNVFTKSGAGTLTMTANAVNTYTGGTFIDGGVLNVSQNSNLGDQGTGAAVTINNGTLQAAATFGLYFGSPGTNNRAVNLENDATFDVSGSNTLTIAGVVASVPTYPGHLIKTDTGTLALSGVNTYAGATVINGGKLSIASTGTLNSTTGVTINGSTANFNYNGSAAYTQPLSFGASGGTLSGAGTISASGGVSAGTSAVIAPGNSPGVLTFTTGLTLASGGTYLWANNGGNSNSQVAGTDFSQIGVTAGTVTLNSGANLSLSFNGTTDFTNAFWTSTETFDLIHKSGTGAVSGSFASGNITVNGTAASLSNATNASLTEGHFSTAITGGDLILTWTPVPTTTATTYTLSAGAGSLNVLLNGFTSASASITNSGTGTADMLNFTGLVSSGAGGIITGTASSGGPLNQGISSNNTGLTFQGTVYGNATLTPSVTTATNATLLSNANNNSTTTATVNVGEANADDSNSQSSFTGTVLTGAVAASGSYAGLASRVFTATAGSGGAGTLNSEATLLAGTSINGNTVSMTWRTRITGEVYSNATDPSIPSSAPHGLVSDVVRLTGMNLAGGQTRGATVQTDDFVLQMSYSGISGSTEAVVAANGGISLAYLDPADTLWTNAVQGNFTVDGNTGRFAITDFLGSYSAFVTDENTAHPGWTLNDVLGSWGVDTAAATDSNGGAIDGDVWAVLNHNSDFGVLAVPEPASLSLLGLGAVGLLASRRRRR